MKKIGILSYPLHPTPPLGGSRQNIGTPFGVGKLEWCRYPMVKKKSKISLFVLAQLTNVTDAQTDRRTPGDSIYRAYASRAKNDETYQATAEEHVTKMPGSDREKV